MLGYNLRDIELLSDVARRNQPSREVYPLNIKEFDIAMDGGLRDGNLIVVSGQTGQGKTLWCQNLTVNLSKKGIPSLWFSYEIGAFYLNQKFEQIEQGEMNIYTPTELIENSLKFIEEKIKRAIDLTACKVIFIDHLHYLIPLDQQMNASLLIGSVVRELKQMAIRNNIIIFLIAHTKKVYQDEQLSLSSIRDSSLISQEADYVFLIERLKKEQKKMDMSGTQWTNQTRIMLAKNRMTGKMIYITCEFQNNKLVPITKERTEELNQLSFKEDFDEGDKYGK